MSKLLLTNDDGIDAPGLAALFDAAEGLGHRVVVAPEEALSGCSHRVTTDRPIRMERLQSSRYLVSGTPADCVRVGLSRVLPDATWILSGINEGGNLGADVFHSGTVAAVREAVLHGLPGIALSQYRRKGVPIDWQRAIVWLRPILQDLLNRPWTRGTFWNVNLPYLEDGSPDPEIVHCNLDPTPLPLSFREEGGLLFYNGNYHHRSRESGADVDVCFGGRIAITQIKLL